MQKAGIVTSLRYRLPFSDGFIPEILLSEYTVPEEDIMNGFGMAIQRINHVLLLCSRRYKRH